jgi:two-component system, NtrC family, nitrogen regulation response regulator NtrX
MKTARILVVDDEAGIRKSLTGVLEDEGYQVSSVATGDDCIRLVSQEYFDLIFLDVWLPGIDGMETLRQLMDLGGTPKPTVIMISGHATIETAVKATRLGAFDFLEKPLSIAKVTVLAKNALEQRRVVQELASLKPNGVNAQNGLSEIIGDSVPIRALRQQLTLMASTNGRVLIYGESGTGKEVVARAIHANSSQRDRAFVDVNCAALPEDLIESELFGHVKGAFPGAGEDKMGKFQRADGGTLFLDEVGDMSLRTQSKLLRVLDEHRFEPVGAARSLQADVRIVAATNKNLEQEIERGNFREDLFYRLNVIPFFVPPLRERLEDVPTLAMHFLSDFARQYRRPTKVLTDEAIQLLKDYDWPGNVRELKNLMERLVIMAPDETITARQIPLKQKGGRPIALRFGSLQEVREAAEREYILRILDETKGNVTRTAEMLGLERSHLYRKMKALEIDHHGEQGN